MIHFIFMQKDNEMKFRLEITFSKILSLLLLISSIYVSIKLEDSASFVTTITVVGGIITNKQYQDRKANKNQNHDTKT